MRRNLKFGTSRRIFMASPWQLFRSLLIRDSGERARIMRQHAADDPNDAIAPWVAAIALREEGEIETAT